MDCQNATRFRGCGPACDASGRFLCGLSWDAVLSLEAPFILSRWRWALLALARLRMLFLLFEVLFSLYRVGFEAVGTESGRRRWRRLFCF